MAAIREWFVRLWGTLRRGRRDADLERELHVHLELAADAARRADGAGGTRAAALRFGGLPQTMEMLRDQRGLPWLEHLARDLRHAIRGLQRSPAFSGAAVLSLGLGIGATTAIFAVVQRVVINPLPYPDSDRIVRLDHVVPRTNAPSLDRTPLGLYYLYGDRARSLSVIAAYRPDAVTLTGGRDEAERVVATRATPSLLEVLRVRPARGRWFNADEAVPGAAPVAVMSHGLWVRRYAADPAILGGSISVSGVPTTVVGIMPPAFVFADPATDLWLAEQTTRSSGFGIFVYTAVARLRDGVSVAAARADLNGVIADLGRVYPESGLAVSLSREGFKSVAGTLKELTIGGVADSLWMLLAAVGVLLVVACVNVANLFLVRTEMRQREVAIRRALGAGRLGIARSFAAEGSVLALAGGGIGLAFAWVAVKVLVWFGPPRLPRLNEIALDATVVAFAVVVSGLTAVLFTVIPMVHATPLAAGLSEAGRGQTASTGRQRVRRLLMGAQIALALVLVVASGLMVRTFQELRTIDPGFDPRSTLTFRIGLPERRYVSRQAAFTAHQALLERLANLPGLTAVSAASCLPLTPVLDVGSCLGNTLFVERGTDLQRPRGLPAVTIHAVAGGYFEALRIRLLRGRLLTATEIARGEPNIVIDKALADAYFPDADALGQRIASSRPPAQGPPMLLTIVGIVANTSSWSVAEPKATPKLYMPMSIAGGPDIPRDALVGPNIAAMSYVLRTSVPPLQILAAVRERIRAFDSSLALSEARTLERRVSESSAQTTFTMLLLATAAAVTLILGLIGTYGVMSYIVSQRRAEIGVRLAFGAEPRAVARMIIRQGGLVAAAGVIVGLVVSLASGRFIESLLYGVRPGDSAVLGAATLTLVGVSLVACWFPARRAARLNPTIALRDE